MSENLLGKLEINIGGNFCHLLRLRERQIELVNDCDCKPFNCMHIESLE